MLVVGLLPIAACSRAGTPQTATLRLLGGSVQVGSDTSPFGPASDGQALSHGDTVRTGEDGRAEILWFEGSITRLDRSTDFTVETIETRGDSTVVLGRQDRGNSFSFVVDLVRDSRFDVSTPTATAGVQGTEYALFVDTDGSTVIAVLDASVRVDALGGEAAVTAGQAFSVPAGAETFDALAPPAPIPPDLLAGDWLTFNATGPIAFEGIPRPFGLAFDAAGYLYVASEVEAAGGGAVYRIGPDGAAGVFAPDLNAAAALAFDSRGVLFVADDQGAVWGVDSGGSRRVAVRFTGAEGDNPNAIAVDATDHLYVLFVSGHLVRYGPDHSAPPEQVANGFDGPQGLAIDPASGSLFVMDARGVVFRIDPDTGTVDQVADLGLEGAQGGLAFGPDGLLYAAGYVQGTVHRVDPAGGDVTICLTGIDTPRGIAFDALGRIYVSSYAADRVLRFDGCEG